MRSPLRVLLLSALILLSAGSLLYRLGSQMNLEGLDGDQMYWDTAPGDKWLYIGGVMVLIGGALTAAAIKFWWGSRRETPVCSLIPPEHR